MEDLKLSSDIVDSLKPEQHSDLGPSLSGSFLNLKFDRGSKTYYSQFGENCQERFSISSQGKVQAGFTSFTKELHHKERGKVKVLFVANARTANTREALVGWSEDLLPEILKIKSELSCDYALFYLSRRESSVFDFFIRPRKKREDQVRFSHLRGMRVQIVQGQKMFAEKPLEHIVIRRAEPDDLKSLSGYVKQVTQNTSLARNVGSETLTSELAKLKNISSQNIALAFNSSGEIVGSLGSLDLHEEAQFEFSFDDVLEPTFNALQGYLKLASWVADLRPVNQGAHQPVEFFTHMYFNNHDIFYSLVCWWIKQTQLLPKKERPVFLYSYYDGDLKAATPSSLFSSAFKGDLYLLHDEDDHPANLLKPTLFADSLDLDLPFFI